MLKVPHLVDVADVVEALDLGLLDLRDGQVRVKQRLAHNNQTPVRVCPTSIKRVLGLADKSLSCSPSIF